MKKLTTIYFFSCLAQANVSFLPSGESCFSHHSSEASFFARAIVLFASLVFRPIEYSILLTHRPLPCLVYLFLITCGLLDYLVPLARIPHPPSTAECNTTKIFVDLGDIIMQLSPLHVSWLEILLRCLNKFLPNRFILQSPYLQHLSTTDLSPPNATDSYVYSDWTMLVSTTLAWFSSAV